MNICANAHSERTVSTIQPQLSSDRLALRRQLGVQWHRGGIELVLKSLDCYTKRLLHSANNFLLLHMYLLFETSPGWLPGWRFSLPRFGGGALSSNVFTICVVYWSLGHPGYFGVSNVALVSQYEDSIVFLLHGGGNVSRYILQNCQHTNANHIKSSCATVDILCHLNVPFSSRNDVRKHDIQWNVKKDMSDFVVR